MKGNPLYMFCIWMTFSSCSTDPVDIVFTGPFENRGVFISCEGNFLSGNASLSFYDIGNRTVHNQVYFAINRVPLGDVAQSLASDGKNLFIVVNNSGKVVVTDLLTLEHKGILRNLISPRYLHLAGNKKAYLSDLYAREIAIIDTETLEITGSIGVSDGKMNSNGHSTECFARVGSLLFVSCWSYDNQLLVIDLTSDTLVDSVTVPRQPRKMVVDAHQMIWLITDGDYLGGTTGFDRPSLVRIDPETRTIQQLLPWPQARVVPRDLAINPAGDSIYFIAGDLYKMAVSDPFLPGKALVLAGNRLLYSMGVDPLSGEIYLTDAVDFTQGAFIHRYTSGGLPIDSFRVGINPGDFLFNRTQPYE